MSNKSSENRRYFSISKEFEQVKDILNEVPNVSRFICEAIVEKYERSNTSDNSTNATFTELLDKMNKILEKSIVNQNLDELIESKVKEVIQNMLVANQLQMLLSGNFVNPQMVATQGLNFSVQPQAPESQNDVNNSNTASTDSLVEEDEFAETINIEEVAVEESEEDLEKKNQKREEMQQRFKNW